MFIQCEDWIPIVLMFLLLQEGPRTMLGIATFDSTVHFYNLKRVLQQVILSFSCIKFSFSCIKFFQLELVFFGSFY